MKMLEIKKLENCSIEEAVQAWNTGFEGYFFDMTTTAEAFEKRLAQEGLGSDISVIAFEDGKPVGLVLNGIRNFQESKIAWNGGTGVAPHMRGEGVGTKLMEETLAILTEKNADTATLEAVSDNKKAIELYRKLGYEIIDDLHYLQLKGEIKTENLPALSSNYEMRKAKPKKTGELKFYRSDFPWQTHWQSVKDGEAIIAFDKTAEPVGYAYFKKINDAEGNLDRTVLYQCVANPAADNREAVAEALLMDVFEGFAGSENRLAVNVPVKENAITYRALEDIGFQVTVEQVFMKKQI